MAANTLSVYVKSPLFEKIKEAQEAKTLNVNEVCARALEEALTGPSQDAPPAPEASQNVITPEQMLEAARALDAQESVNYEISYCNSPQEAGALLQLVADDSSSWVVSMTIDPSGRFVFLIGSNGA